jgi:hypothetical protein
VTAAAKNGHDAEAEHDDEITIERRVKLPPEALAYGASLTTRIGKIDSRLLAIARGELDPEDPFGGLIPIYENDDVQEVDDSWLLIGAPQPPPLPPTEPAPPSEAESYEGILGRTIPTMRMQDAQLMLLAIDARSGFFASQIDGKRSVEELIDVCGFDELEALEIIDELLRLAAIELR